MVYLPHSLKTKLIWLLVLSFCPMLGWADAEQDLAQVEKRITTVKQTLQQKREQQAQSQQQLKRVETTIGRLTAQLNDLQTKAKDKKQLLKQLEKELAAKQAHLQQQQKAMLKQIKAVYISGEHDYLKLLFSQDDPAQFNRMLTYYRYLHTARSTAVNELQKSLTEVENKQQAVLAQQKEIQQLQQNIQQEQEQLVQQKQEREALLKQLTKQISSQESKLAKLLEDRRRLTQLVKRLESERRQAELTKVNFKQLKGKLKLPVKGKITQRFGDRLTGSDLTATGLLFAAEEGDWVSAVAPGKVVFADWLRGFGLLIILEHNQGYMTLYGRNQALLKQTGDIVAAGESIAQVGKSGGFKDPGLYFEIRQNGTPVNPQQWLKK